MDCGDLAKLPIFRTMAVRDVRGGMTLVEILIAVTFLAICAAAILETVLTADTQGAYALRRALVLSSLQDQIEAARGRAAGGSLTGGSNTVDMTVAGLSGPVSITTITTQRANSRSL